MLKTQLVLFDLDGVLVNACDWHYEALNRALREISNTEIGRKEHEGLYNGLPTRVKLAALADFGRIKAEDMEAISDLKQKYTTEVINEKCKMDVEKVRVMSWLRDRNITIMCVTNSIRKTALQMLVNSCVKDFMFKVISNEDITNSKPNHEGYVAAMVMAQTLPENTVIFEDSPKGIEAASGLGAKVVKVKDADDVTVDLMIEVIK